MGRIDRSGPLSRICVDSTPFTIGRQPGLSLTLQNQTVSSRHAQITLGSDYLRVRDLGSRNGTYVNGRPVDGERPISDGDLLQLADVPLRIGRNAESIDTRTVQAAQATCDQALALTQFEKLMSSGEVLPVFQPIVSLPQRQVVGYEVLGRSRFYGLKNAHSLFLAASQLNLEKELSQMFRVAGIEKAIDLPGMPKLFLNTHPSELLDCGLLESLAELRRNHPAQPIVLEIHEAAVTSTERMRELHAALQDLQMELAYDDFGAGQSRLIELREVPPDYLKFDMQLLRHINRAAPEKQSVVASLVKMSHELGICPLAEGVETEEESAACVDLGFVLGQGFLYGRPQAAHCATTGEPTELMV